MDAIATALKFSSTGMYRAALDALRPADDKRETSTTQLHRAELLALLGKCGAARPIVESLQKLKGLTDGEKTHLEYVASLISRETGAFDDELQHLQKAIFHADRAGDLERAFWANST